MKYGIDKLWGEDIKPCCDLTIKFFWSAIKLFPILFVWGWWVYDAVIWYLGEWYKFWLITKYVCTPGAMVVEWGIVFAVLFVLNGAMSKRLVYGNKLD